MALPSLQDSYALRTLRGAHIARRMQPRVPIQYFEEFDDR